MSSVHLASRIAGLNSFDPYHFHHHCLLLGLLAVRLNRPGRFLLLQEDQVDLGQVENSETSEITETSESDFPMFPFRVFV